MKISRLRIKTAKPVGSVINSYLIVTVVLLSFLIGLMLLAALELLLLG